ncbi:MAG: ATPase P [Syntrophobacteraceae bacterium]
MLEIAIPGYKHFSLRHLVLDYNGTLACDGKLIAGVGERLELLSKHLGIHVLTADTFGGVAGELSGLPCRLSVIPKQEQAVAKAAYVGDLGTESCAAIGNGSNDRMMLKEAALGIALVQAEGASIEAVLAADVLSRNIGEALDLLLNPLRLTATLRG